jgi:hypothetical protein
LADHVWAVSATGRRDGSPQQAIVGYTLDDEGRVLISTQSFTAKWQNAVRQQRVCLIVPDERVQVLIYGMAETLDADLDRAELSADILAVVRGPERPDPSTIVGWLDEHRGWRWWGAPTMPGCCGSWRNATTTWAELGTGPPVGSMPSLAELVAGGIPNEINAASADGSWLESSPPAPSRWHATPWPSSTSTICADSMTRCELPRNASRKRSAHQPPR